MTSAVHLITASEASRRLRVGIRTVIRWIEAGEVKVAGKLAGKNGAWLIDEREVARVAQKRREDLLARLPQETAPDSRADQEEVA